jgi:deazaflavin-dependent oxidoreductase (nitroreductase family)
MRTQQRVMNGVVKSMNVIHRVAMKVSGGKVGSNLKGMPVVELHTTGRKSGQRRSVMLTCPIYSPDQVVVIASKGGDDRHPDWYHNIQAQPAVEITEQGVTRPMRARTASTEEKAEMWPVIVEANKGYAGYQKKTERDIPVVILEPA